MTKKKKGHGFDERVTNHLQPSPPMSCPVLPSNPVSCLGYRRLVDLSYNIDPFLAGWEELVPLV